MRSTSFILLAGLLALMIFGSVGVYAYDASRDDMIAEGVTVGGVDVGGMRASEARVAIDDQLAKPLSEPLVVKYRGKRFRLSAAKTRLRADVEGMVQSALERSREGNVVSRATRYITGGRVDAQLPPRVSYSRRAVDSFVRRVKRGLDRPARDARVDYSVTGFKRVRSQNGIALQAGHLERAINRQLTRPGGDRIVKARTRVTKPDVTMAELGDKYPHFVTVDRGAKRLRYFRNLKHVKTYKIAVGRVGFDTPAGLYHVQNKGVNVAWSVPEWGGKLAGKVIPGGAPNNPLKARWLGIYDGAGIHGTDDIASLGTAASHGCIRMSIPEVIELYDRVPVQTPVYIQ